jgi:hypothetical protein
MYQQWQNQIYSYGTEPRPSTVTVCTSQQQHPHAIVYIMKLLLSRDHVFCYVDCCADCPWYDRLTGAGLAD